eukprot:5715521-Prymnesium_polylepis.1
MLAKWWSRCACERSCIERSCIGGRRRSPRLWMLCVCCCAAISSCMTPSGSSMSAVRCDMSTSPRCLSSDARRAHWNLSYSCGTSSAANWTCPSSS